MLSVIGFFIPSNTDNLILKSLVIDIKKKPQNRKAELELGAKIKGMLVDRQEVEGELSIKWQK